MVNKIKNTLFPNYKKILTAHPLKDNECVFCMQWGKNFPFENNSGFLFVGKSVNQWGNGETDVNQLFDINNPTRIFSKDDQMEWVSNHWGRKNGYNTKKSAFWRLIKKVVTRYYPEEWYSHIAWTNLYKISPGAGGNPNRNLKKTQEEYCFDILIKEIKILSPKYVIMLTSGWEKDFLKHLNNQEVPNVFSERNWGKYKTRKIGIKGITIIVSHHPQGKPELEHERAIVELINEDNYNSIS